MANTMALLLGAYPERAGTVEAGDRWPEEPVGAGRLPQVNGFVVEVATVKIQEHVQQQEQNKHPERIDAVMVVGDDGARSCGNLLDREQNEVGDPIKAVDKIVGEEQPEGKSLPFHDSDNEVQRDDAVDKDKGFTGITRV